jgi:transcriptional regulator with XRE-family HTH domain
MQSIGRRILAQRTAFGYTQEKLGKMCGVSRAAVSQWEKDITIPTGPNLVALAAALEKSPEWLTGKTRSLESNRTKVAVVGYIGAGAEVIPFDDFAKGVGLNEVEAPMGYSGECVAVQVRGNSMYPIEDGWLVFYRKDLDGVDESAVNKLCVVKVADGATLIKKLRKGSRKGLFNLESWNAPLQEDVRLDWAAPVIDIRPA